MMTYRTIAGAILAITLSFTAAAATDDPTCPAPHIDHPAVDGRISDFQVYTNSSTMVVQWRHVQDFQVSYYYVQVVDEGVESPPIPWVNKPGHLHSVRMAKTAGCVRLRKVEFQGADLTMALARPLPFPPSTAAYGIDLRLTPRTGAVDLDWMSPAGEPFLGWWIEVKTGATWSRFPTWVQRSALAGASYSYRHTYTTAPTSYRLVEVDMSGWEHVTALADVVYELPPELED